MANDLPLGHVISNDGKTEHGYSRVGCGTYLLDIKSYDAFCQEVVKNIEKRTKIKQIVNKIATKA